MSHPWYHLPVWRQLRKIQLTEYPLCSICAKVGVTTAANTVDHLEPFKGDWELFIGRKNHQSVCASCHNRHKQIKEKGGIIPGCDVNGFPIDGNHPWNQYEKTINEKEETL